MIRSALIFSFALLVGCGISDNTAIADLEEDDWTKLCEEVEFETFTCEAEGFSYDVSFGSEDCEAETDADLDLADTCEATVGDWRACDEAYREALREDACTADLPSECSWMTDCITLE